MSGNTTHSDCQLGKVNVRNTKKLSILRRPIKFTATDRIAVNISNDGNASQAEITQSTSDQSWKYCYSCYL